MPTTRLLIRAALGVLVLLTAGCTGEQRWEQDVTFTVAEIYVAESGREMARLEVSGELPGDPLKKFHEYGLYKDEYPPGVSDGDTVVCHVVQTADNTLDDSKEIDVSNCRKA